MKRFIFIAALALFVPLCGGCGYTTSSSLSPEFKRIHIEEFANKIDFSSAGRRNIYLPLLELRVKQAVVNRFQFDGHLRISPPESADLVLKGELVQYQRNPLQYTDNDDVKEYRIYLIVNLKMIESGTGEVLWEENGFSGETTYFISGPQATSEESAVEEATVDLARRIVERTIENW